MTARRPTSLLDPAIWEHRAAEMRAIAREAGEDNHRLMILATEYEGLARRAGERARCARTKQQPK